MNGWLNQWRGFGGLTGAVVLVSVLAATGCNKEEKAFTPPPPPTVTVGQPVVEHVMLFKGGPARLAASDSVQVPARVSGVIEEIRFKDGEFVEAGQVLYIIEPEPFEAAVAQAEAALASAKAASGLADATLQRFERAAKSGAVSGIDVLEAQAKKEEAVASVKSSEAALVKAKLDLSYTVVKAPFFGKISESNVDIGEYVGAGGQTLLAEVTSMDPIYAYFNASEREVLRFQKDGKKIPRSISGQDIPVEQRIEAQIRLADGRVYEHTGYVDYAATKIDPNTATLRVRVRLPNPKFTLFPGQSCQVMIANYDGDATLVPEVAVMRDLVGPFLLGVDTANDNTIVRMPVKLGPLMTDRRIIEEGITTEDNIVTVGVQRARPGLPVTPKGPGFTTVNAASPKPAAAGDEPKTKSDTDAKPAPAPGA